MSFITGGEAPATTTPAAFLVASAAASPPRCSVHGCARPAVWDVSVVTTDGRTTYRSEPHPIDPQVCHEHRELVAGEPILLRGPLNPFHPHAAKPACGLWWPSAGRVDPWVDPRPWAGNVSYLDFTLTPHAFAHLYGDGGDRLCTSPSCGGRAAFSVTFVDWDFAAGRSAPRAARRARWGRSCSTNTMPPADQRHASLTPPPAPAFRSPPSTSSGASCSS